MIRAPFPLSPNHYTFSWVKGIPNIVWICAELATAFPLLLRDVFFVDSTTGLVRMKFHLVGHISNIVWHAPDPIDPVMI